MHMVTTPSALPCPIASWQLKLKCTGNEKYTLEVTTVTWLMSVLGVHTLLKHARDVLGGEPRTR